MSKYDVNFKRMALLMLPTFWRRPLIAAIAYATTTPLNYIYTVFTTFRQSTDYRLRHNGQVCYLQAMLNDRFDLALRRITVTDDPSAAEPVVLWQRSEGRSLMLPMRDSGLAVMVNRRGFSGVNAIDFWVNIPVVLLGTVDIDRLTALVNVYKLASKRFSINYQ